VPQVPKCYRKPEARYRVADDLLTWEQENPGKARNAYIEFKHFVGVDEKKLSRWVKEYREWKEHELGTTDRREGDSVLDRFTPVFLAVFLAHYLILRIGWSDVRKKSRLTAKQLLRSTLRWCENNKIEAPLVPDHFLYPLFKQVGSIRSKLTGPALDAYNKVLSHHRRYSKWRLYRCQTDHTEFTFRGLQNGKEEPVRVFLTTIICILTDVVVGYALHFGVPTAFDVLDAVFHAVLPKPAEDRYPYHGRIHFLQADNGVFDSEEFRAACRRLGTHVDYTEPGKPTQNGDVEKCGGDVKRGIVYDIERLILASGPTSITDQYSTFSEDFIRKETHSAILRLIRNSHRGQPSRDDRWREAQLPPDEFLAEDSDKLRALCYVEHFDVSYCGDIATLADGRKFSCPKLRACPGQVLTIREWTFEPDRLLIASIHNGLDRRELGALRPLGGKKANEERVARSVEAPTESVPTTVTPLASSPEAVPTSNPPTPPPVATPDSSPPQRTRQFSPRLP
jgi:transposase InsO family protein